METGVGKNVESMGPLNICTNRGRKLRVTLVISSLGLGGAERVMTWLANELVTAGHAVTLVTLEVGTPPPAYALNPSVEVRRVGVPAGKGPVRTLRIAQRLWRLRQAILGAIPQVVVSFVDNTNLLVLIATAGEKFPMVISERTDPAHHQIGFLGSTLRRMLYPLAHCVVVQTKGVLIQVRGRFGERVVVIPNPVPCPKAGGRSPNHGSRRIVAAGRLVVVKGFDRLIDAFAQIAGAFPDWQMVIFGEGPLRTSLEARVQACGLAGRVTFPGVTRQLDAELAASALFVLSSRYEGFPNVLAEAVAAGLPAIAFADVSGVDELIDPDVSGLVIPPDPDPTAALAQALRSVMSDEGRRAAMSRATAAVAARYTPKAVFMLWEQLLRAAAFPD